MITLILEDFRVFERRQFTFDECKSILISGQSGAGKTTLFMAINFAVYGTGRDLIRHGKQKCRVIFKTNDISITRSKGPSRLIVEKDNRTYEKDEAQAIINSTYPHMHLGYVSQSSHKSFILLTPVEKLKYIENMIADKTFIENMCKTAKTLICDRKMELEKTKKERETMESMLCSLGIERTVTCPTGSYTKEDLLRAQEKKELCVRKVNSAKHDLAAKKILEEEIQCMETCDITIPELENRIETLTHENYMFSQYSSVLAELEKLEKPTNSVEEIDDMITACRRIAIIDRELAKATKIRLQLESLNCARPLKTIEIDDDDIQEYLRNASNYEKLADINKRLTSLPQSTWTCAELDEMACKIKNAAKYSENKKLLEKLTARKAECTLMKTCPTCKSRLAFWKGELFAVDDSNVEKNAIVLTVQEATDLDREIMALSVECNGMDGILEEVDRFKNVDIAAEMKNQRWIEENRASLVKRKNEIGKVVDNYDANVVNELNAYLNALALYRENMKEYRILSARLDEYKEIQKERCEIQTPPITSVEKLQIMKESALHYAYLTKKCADLKCLQPTENVDVYRKNLLIATQKQDKIAQLLSIDVTDEHLIFLERELENAESELDSVQKFIKSKEAYDQWQKVQNVSVAEKSLCDSYPRALKLQALINEAEKESLKETLEELNFYSQMYVEQFVENLSIEFIFDTKILVNITHNGHKTDVNSLSGGECSRVILAVTLALAEMHNVKFLMLDESVSSLDQETTNVVMKAIRNNFNGTTLCIAHQTIKGTFDRVIEL